MSDYDNTLLTKIAKSVRAIEVAFANQALPPPEMDVTVTNFPDPQNVVVTNLPGVQNVAFPATQPVSVENFPNPMNVTASFLTNFGKPVSYFSLAPVAAGTTLIAAGSPGNRNKVLGFLITATVNVTVQFFSGATPITGLMDIPGRGNLSVPVSVLSPCFQTNPGDVLSITSAGGAVKGFIAYLTEP